MTDTTQFTLEFLTGHRAKLAGSIHHLTEKLENSRLEVVDFASRLARAKLILDGVDKVIDALWKEPPSRKPDIAFAPEAYIDTPEAAQAYFEEADKTANPVVIADALKVIERAGYTINWTKND